MIVDQFDVLYEEAARRPGSVFGLSLHPFLVGQPFRIRALERALRHIREHDGVWLCTSDEIADWYARRNVTSPARGSDTRQLAAFSGGPDTDLSSRRSVRGTPPTTCS
jgi:hypothetical protein